MARKKQDEDVRETNRRMTPSERQAEDVPSPDRSDAETLHMPRPGTGTLIKGEKRPREKGETERSAECAVKRDGRKT